MRSIDITFHMVNPKSAKFPFPIDDLQILYLTAGIELNVVEGAAIASDPSDDAIDDYQSLVDRYRTSAKTSGHLILGVHPPSGQPEVAGQLHDPISRGLVSAYTDSSYIQREGASGLLQTCAHELGHMFNLAHEDIVPGYVTVMEQGRNRTTNIDDAWSKVEQEATRMRDDGKNPFFFRPPRRLDCYPFAYEARRLLNTLSDHRLRPWGGIFERTFDGMNDQ